MLPPRKVKTGVTELWPFPHFIYDLNSLEYEYKLPLVKPDKMSLFRILKMFLRF